MTAASVSAMQPLISVIVPVFNVASYIEEGMASLAEQSFTQPYEVILVDDCSNDGSIEFCRQAVNTHPELFRLIESERNGGVSVARNLGLDQAQGNYIMFVDPDDILPTNALSRMFAAAEQHNADIVKGNLVLFDENSRRPASDQVHSTRLIVGEDALTELYQHSRVRGHIGGKMYRRDRFGQMRFTVGVRMAQDLLFFSELFAAARSLVLLSEEVYLYRKHQGGSTGRKYEKSSYIDWLDAVEESGKFARSSRQCRAHKSLLVRTMTQIARECRNIPATSAAAVLNSITEKCRQWNIRLFHLIFIDRLGPRSISRYIKLQLALRQIRNNLSNS